VCWAFDTVPSKLDKLYWSITFKDVKTRLKLKVGSAQAGFVQDYQTMALLLGQLFGGSETQAEPPPTFEAARLQLAQVLGGL
jgi:hypothetical protein